MLILIFELQISQFHVTGDISLDLDCCQVSEAF